MADVSDWRRQRGHKATECVPLTRQESLQEKEKDFHQGRVQGIMGDVVQRYTITSQPTISLHHLACSSQQYNSGTKITDVSFIV